MLRIFGKYWWSFFMRGIFALTFGLIAVFLPGITMKLMAYLLAVFFIGDALISIAAWMKDRRHGRNLNFLLFEALVGFGLGFSTFIWPKLTIFAVVLSLGLWALITGVFAILAAIKLRSEIQGEWVLGVSGLLSIMVSLILFANPGISAVAIILVIGVYAVLLGVALIALGLRLRKHNVIVVI